MAVSTMGFRITQPPGLSSDRVPGYFLSLPM
jgi:hypothetical protein